MKEVNVKKLLKKYDLYDKSIASIDYHMNVLDSDAVNLIARLEKDGYISDIDSKDMESIAKTLCSLIKSCDASKPNYNSKLDEEMIRYGLQTDTIHAKKNRNELYSDDGGELTSIYDKNIDIMNDNINIKGK